MKYLNLSKGFNPYDAEDSELIDFESFIFSGGEPHIKLDFSTFNDYDSVTITHRINNMNDLGLLMVAISALDRLRVFHRFLFLPYFPGARQDRVMVQGEPLTVWMYAVIINKMRFSKVTILDPHSDVTEVAVVNSEIINNHKFVEQALNDLNFNISKYHLISPDAGSNKKIKDLAIHLNGPNVIKCDKTRNTSTGKITGFEVYADDLLGQPCVIVDDICDGGGTFLGLAKELEKKNAGDLYLIVTHGIFSKGPTELIKHFKCIYTTDSIGNVQYLTSDYSRVGTKLASDRVKTSQLKEIKIKDIL